MLDACPEMLGSGKLEDTYRQNDRQTDTTQVHVKLCPTLSPPRKQLLTSPLFWFPVFPAPLFWFPVLPWPCSGWGEWTKIQAGRAGRHGGKAC